MERLKREIGYRPDSLRDLLKKNKDTEGENMDAAPEKPTDLTAKIDTVIPIKVEDVLALQKLHSEKIVAWLKEHPDFKWTPMCKSLEIDKGYFSRTIRSKEPIFKLEHIVLIENKIKQYGYM